MFARPEATERRATVQQATEFFSIYCVWTENKKEEEEVSSLLSISVISFSECESWVEQCSVYELYMCMCVRYSIQYTEYAQGVSHTTEY